MRPKQTEWAEIPPSPRLSVRFVDSHLHLEGLGSEELVSLAAATRTLLFTCGVDKKSSEAVLQLASSHPETVKAFVGTHPSEALKDVGVGWVPKALGRASGVGEVGLDPKYSGTGARSSQMKALLGQLEAAQTQGKPVQVHSRGAEKECLEVLGGFRLKAVLMHWFQGEGRYRTVVDRGYYVSVGPALLYSKRLQKLARLVGREQVLSETDTPVPFGPIGGVHGPSLIPSVVFKLAEVWGVPFEEARETVLRNSSRFLGGLEKG